MRVWVGEWLNYVPSRPPRQAVFYTNDQGELAVSLHMNRLSLRNNRLKLETAWNLSIILEDFIEYTPI